MSLPFAPTSCHIHVMRQQAFPWMLLAAETTIKLAKSLSVTIFHFHKQLELSWEARAGLSLADETVCIPAWNA